MRLDGVRRRKRLISLTPLIDVVFLLLIFFMLTTSFAREGAVAVETARGGSPAGGGEAAVVTVGPEGGFALAGESLAPDALVRRLDPQRAVILSPAEATSLQTLLDARAFLAREGFDALSFSLGREGR